MYGDYGHYKGEDLGNRAERIRRERAAGLRNDRDALNERRAMRAAYDATCR